MEFKEILLWLGLFIIGSLIVNFLIYPSSFQSFKSNVKNIIPEINFPQKSTSLEGNNYCENNIIPNQIIFEYNRHMPLRTGEDKYFSSLISSWKDGTKIMYKSSDKFYLLYWKGKPLCRIGENEGENKNFAYCENFFYKKTMIDNKGNIGETKIYSINLTLDRNTLVISKKDEWISSASFEIIDYTCNKY